MQMIAHNAEKAREEGGGELQRFHQAMGKTPGCAARSRKAHGQDHTYRCWQRRTLWKKSLQEIETPVTSRPPEQSSSSWEPVRRLHQKQPPTEDMRMQVDADARKRKADQVEALPARTVKSGPPWYDTNSGERLDDEQVAKGMQTERQRMQELPVYRDSSLRELRRLEAEGKEPMIVGAGWVLTQKTIDMVRARLVATQVNTFSWVDTFSPTPTLPGQRLLLLRALRRNWEVEIADISVAFLHARLPEGEHIFIRPPANRTTA